MKKQKLERHYSKKKSKEFWKIINSFQEIDSELWDRLYSLGVLLQDLEGFVLKEIERADKK